ncbi:NADH dehydrogenase subunit C [Jatrophihabitans sp. GAS493]|uniref:NADH-quinone oxidoreductase subunit C n=1 Tax=Jatrophihabitans sp. GAS493 TaxID=1907575 RepID=UPI000BB7D4A1|nr:NADH-quinone oxidoreductase subunit C [Jatrophihabitans sp. GAS493]SOD72317.1 NADH dehydrogenase subunit C [Jatrophihabitans sp. GAS493]
MSEPTPPGNLPVGPPDEPAPVAQPVTPDADSTIGVAHSGLFGVSGSGDTTGFGGLVRAPWVAPGAERPYGSYFDDLVDAIQDAYQAFDQAVVKVVVDRGELTLHINPSHTRTLAQTLRDDPALRFELLSSVSGVDYLGTENRLHSVYHLTSLTYRWRIRLETAVSVDNPHVPSVTPIYPTADWQERETYDMFGIIYDGHPSLTRILMPDDWEGHPQRKDYPLGGIAVQYKGATIPPPDERRTYR